ncbi:MAG: serine/threonine-protein kinase, partial [Polyangiaceae bacterium]
DALPIYVVARFEREAQAAGRIGSEHIVEVLDLGNLPSGERFVVMEYRDGEDLTARIKGLGKIPPVQCIPLMDQILEGLAAAHDAQIIHRDLKPDNIYILTSKAGRADFVKILDFGVSKFSALDSEMSMTRTGAVMGTPYYMSPEQAKGVKVDNRSDLYAIGVVLYQMLTGRVPFNASSFNELLFKIALESPEPIQDLCPNCPPEMVQIVDRAMQRQPESRFQCARDFQQAILDLEPILGTVPAPAGRSSQLPAVRPSSPGLGTPAGGLTPLPGQIQASLAGSQPGLAGSQPGLAVTPAPKTKGGLMVALVAAGLGVVTAGGVAAYLLVGPGSKPDSSVATPVAATSPEAPEVDEEPTPPAEPAASATASAAAEPDVTPSAEPSAAPAIKAPVAARPYVYRRPAARKRTPATAKPPAPPPPTSDTPPPPKPKSTGRKIQTEL